VFTAKNARGAKEKGRGADEWEMGYLFMTIADRGNVEKT
jgi:hypothetical protein